MRDLAFLGLDELHVYRGRQGADVAMLVRRVRQRAHRGDLLTVGTSATMATGDTREDKYRAVAASAGRLFGATGVPGNVIDETLSPRDHRGNSSNSRCAARGRRRAPARRLG